MQKKSTGYHPVLFDILVRYIVWRGDKHKTYSAATAEAAW